VKGKQYLVVGAGMMGEAIAYDLLKSPNVGRVRIVDIDPNKAAALAGRLVKQLSSSAKVEVDHWDGVAFAKLVDGFDAVVGAAHYGINVELTKACIAAGCHFVDLGGNNHVVKQQVGLSDRAAKAGVGVMPACGIAPGAVSVLVAYAVDAVGDPDYVRIRVGGLPLKPQGPLKYALVFSASGLINECHEMVEVLKDGKPRMVEPLTGLETERFREPFGTLEAVFTSGGTATLTETYKDRVKELNYKTLRYPGHWQAMTVMRGLGYWDDTPVDLGNKVVVSPRALTERLLAENLPKTPEDALVMRISVGHGRPRHFTEMRLDMIDVFDAATGHTAMQRTTGYTASIIAQMLANGVVKGRGTLRLEQSVPPEAFLQEWRKRGLVVQVTQVP
jgi:lysine 6-dehydrogenase